MKRLVKKTLLENKLKALREKAARNEEQRTARKKELEERKVAWQLKREEVDREMYRISREHYEKQEKLKKERREKSREKIRLKALAAESAATPN